MGFGADVKSRDEVKIGDILLQIQPEDLLKYGLIPELIGRLPAIATFHELDEKALISILTKPKNALVKQYQKLFDMEKVELEFGKDALKSIVDKAMESGTGARALRSIMEKVMMDIMYILPSKNNIGKCIITLETITKGSEPVYIKNTELQKKSA